MKTDAAQFADISQAGTWSMVEVGDLGEFVNGYPFKPGEWAVSKGDPIIRIQNLTDPAKPFNYFAGDIGARYRVHPGDLLVSWSASLDAFLWNGPDAWLNQHIFKVTPNMDVVDPDFLYFLMKREIRNIALSARGSTMKHVTGKIFRQHRVSLPPLDEQRRIARILSTIQVAIASSDNEVRNSRTLRRSLLTTLLRDAQKSSPMLPLEDIATIERGRFTHRPRNDPAFYGGDTPFIQTGDITRVASAGGIVRGYSQTLNERGLEVSRVFPERTIAITIAANIGFTAMLAFPAAFPDSIIAITPTAAVDAEYLNYYLSTQQEEMDRRAPRGTQKNINIEFLRPWPVLVPSLKTQETIAEAMRVVEAEITACSQDGAALRQLFSSAFSTLLEPAP
jgi:type I restriction enzyme S subunit